MKRKIRNKEKNLRKSKNYQSKIIFVKTQPIQPIEEQKLLKEELKEKKQKAEEDISWMIKNGRVVQRKVNS